MTAGELIAILQDLCRESSAGPDTPVIVATQRSWPLQCEVEAVALVDDDNSGGDAVVYLGAGDGREYVPQRAVAALGWTEAK